MKKIIMNEKELKRTIERMAHEVVEKNFGVQNLTIVGIQTRGVHIARRIAQIIASMEGCDIPQGTLDITFYRDDVGSIEHQPAVKETHIPFDITAKTVLLVDDVIYSGRTVRCALDALIDFGRPHFVRLAVLIDRGRRELPIQPDCVGKFFPAAKQESINVRLKETDGCDEVVLVKKKKTTAP